MHRTEGTNHAANLFTNGPPGTTVEEDFLNAIQEEICGVVEGAGISLKTAATETRDQLLTALQKLFVEHGSEIGKNAIINGNFPISQRGVDWNAGFPEKVTDGVFAAAGAWTWGAGWAHDGGNFEADATASNADLEQDVSAVAGETYIIVFTISNSAGGSIQPQIGGVNGASLPTTGGGDDGTFTQIIKATGAGNLKFQATGSTCSIDDVSVKKHSLSNDDDVYILDRWILLSDGNNIVDVSQSTEAPTGSLLSCALDVETINKKFGILQVIEQKNCAHMIGGNVSLSFQAKVSDIAKLDNIKAAVISWDGTVDTVTSDIISAWNVEDTIPTLVANWTIENSPANLGVTASWVKYTIPNIFIDTAGTKNIGVFIWSDGFSDTLAKFLYITNVQLELNSVSSEYGWRNITDELALCQRYFTKSYDQGVFPGVVDTDGAEQFAVTAVANADHDVKIAPKFAVTMRSVPTVTTYDSAGASGKAETDAGNGKATTVSHQGETGCYVTATNGAASLVRSIRFQYTAEIEL